MELVNDYYVVLGVPRNESTRGIRDAYHDLAMRYHPDRAGDRAMRLFQRIVQAYHTLSDQDRRTSYDRGLQHAASGAIAEPTRLCGAGEGGALVPRPLDVLRDFEARTPSAEEVLLRFLRNFTGQGVPKSERLQPLELNVVLSSDQAARGGALTLGVPVFYPCATCHGSGHDGSYCCGTCLGSGMVEDEAPVRLHLEPGIRDGALFELPLRGLGIHNLFLRVTVRVVAAPVRAHRLAAGAIRG